VRGGSRPLRVGHRGRTAGEASLGGEGSEAQGRRARYAEVRDAEAREAEAREAASRKGKLWTLRAERHVDAGSVKNVSVHCEQEHDATHTVPSSPARTCSAGLPSARGVGGTERGLYGGNRAAARTRFCGRIQTAGEENLHPMENKFRIEREYIAGTDALGAPHETDDAAWRRRDKRKRARSARR
jgi:hypothetical protein